MFILFFSKSKVAQYVQIPSPNIINGSFKIPEEKSKILGKIIIAQNTFLKFSFGYIFFNVLIRNTKPIKLKKEKNKA